MIIPYRKKSMFEFSNIQVQKILDVHALFYEYM